ncbi:hypothetical protein N7454_002762 [Penicillium verhagenii]|nr:hypothetical protein N7454_002762 [Penicillium verhagenii]
MLGALASFSVGGQETLALVINAMLSLCTDGMMFAHSVFLRWTLYREQRLEFNISIRLFTSSLKFGPNKWYINLLALACLVLSYASSSILLLSNQVVPQPEAQDKSSVLINATALVALRFGLAGQAIIAGRCLISSRNVIPTWSSKFLNTASVLVQKGDLAYHPGRCMISVHQKDMPNQGIYATKQQGSMLQVQSEVRYILAFLWSLAILAVAWPITIAVVSQSIGNASAVGQNCKPSCWRLGFDWHQSSLPCSRNFVTLSLSPYANDHSPSSATFSYGAEAILCVLFVCLIQALQTVALHCLELLVNLSRDEATWRRACCERKKPPGTQLVTNAFFAAASSWENSVLFVAKSLLHWIIGQSLIPSISIEDAKELESAFSVAVEDLQLKHGFQFDMVYSRLIIYAILAILLATFSTYLALKRSKGCQPAALGHLQTLADLVDDWKTDQDGRMWWGDKTMDEACQLRHAGTCPDKTMLRPICAARYAGGIALPN